MIAQIENASQNKTREQLILEHFPQVKLIAKRIQHRCPENVTLDDLISAGTVGLISAIDKYDATQGVKLNTYAEYKIRGAILDSLRSMDWAPREQRRRVKQMEKTAVTLEQKLHRAPTEQEVAAELGISMDEYREWVVETRAVNIGSIEIAGAQGEEGTDLLQFISHDKENWPSQLLERAELERLVTRTVERMPQTERTVLSLYFQQELTLREIAKVMNLHESRISQLKAQGLSRLRSYMQKSWPVRGKAESLQMAATA